MARSQPDGTDHPEGGAAPFIPARPTLERLRATIDGCRGCDLYRDATQGVMGEGPVTARLVLVGEQPGDKEDLAGRPFVGPAGKLLDRALAEAGIPSDTTYRTNAVKHFRHVDRGARRIHKSPVRWQVAACEPWLLTELDLIHPGVVVLLGATAGQAVFGSAFRVGASRGHPLEWPDSGTELAALDPAPTAIATTHPSAILRSRERDTDYAAFVRDLDVARQLLDSGSTGEGATSD